MKRREFITLLGTATAAWPLAARAQQPGIMRRIGVMMARAGDDLEAKAQVMAFLQGLGKRGWSEARNIHVDYRFVVASGEQYQLFAKDLISLKPDVILAHSTQVTATLQRATSTIPIVFVNVSNPIEAGFVANLARPGGNLTGVLHYESSIVGKWLSMLKEIAPRVTRIAVVGNPTVNGAYDYFLQAAQAAGQSLAMEVVSSPIEDVATNIERVFESLARGPDCGVVVPPDATAISNRDLIIALTARHRLPAVYAFGYFVAAGGLMSYSTDQVDMFRLSANYVDRILRGDKPADLPVQIPTKYEMTINLTAAKALGLTAPPGLLVAADEVIE